MFYVLRLHVAFGCTFFFPCAFFRAIYEGDNYPMLMSLHLSVASRLLLNSPQAFNEMVAAVAAEEGKAHAEVAGEEIF